MKNINMSKKMKEKWKDEEFRNKMIKIGKEKKFSEETRKKMSKSHKGKKLSKETKNKIGKAMRGHPCYKDEKRNKKISKTLKGRHISPKTEFKKGLVSNGRKWTKEQKDHMSKIMKEKFKQGLIYVYTKNDKWYFKYLTYKTRKYNRSFYGDDWNKIRLLIYNRDNFTCKKCGISLKDCRKKYNQALHIHHKVPFLISFDNSLDNLITLCPKCHKEEENLYWKKLNERRIVKI